MIEHLVFIVSIYPNNVLRLCFGTIMDSFFYLSLTGKRYQSDTTIHTEELLAKIMRRKGDAMAQIEAEMKEKEERDASIIMSRKQGKYK